jgi:hypothetical protein
MKKYLLLSLSLVIVAACGSTGEIADSGSDAGNTDDQSAADAPLGDAEPGVPITGLTPGTWNWVDFPTALCRDGTPTGIGISPSTTGSKKLMIFLEGGGACFNAQTCGSNPSHFAKSELTGVFIPAEGTKGIFSRTDTSNAVADWNMVYVPYCTGDVHAGNAPNATVTGVAGTQQFVGYTNVSQYLSRIVPTFPDMQRVLLTGQSAGGFGAALNYVQTARSFGSVPVDLLDDAGPLMGNPYLASCLETNMANLWGLTKTVIGQDCGTDCTDVGNSLAEYWTHIPKTYPNARFGFIDSTGDSVISTFFGFGANNCTGFQTVPAAQYEAGLLGMRTSVAANSNAGLFIYAGTDHTTVVSMYTLRSAPDADGGTVKFEDWVTSLVTDSVSNVGP